MAVACSSLVEAQELLHESLGVKLDTKTLSTLVKSTAKRARARLKAESLEFPETLRGCKVVVSIDGGRLRIRKNRKGRRTKKGRMRYHTDWREPKLLTIYIVGPNGRQQRGSRPWMDATMKGPDELFAMLEFYLTKLQVAQATSVVVCADGATWIWERVKTLMAKLGIENPRCVQVLDDYHAVEHCTTIAKVKRWKVRERKAWVHKQKHRLLKGKMKGFMKELERVCQGRHPTLRRELKYFKKHQARMNYKEFKRQGYPLGSGAVESGIRRVINLRMKGNSIRGHSICRNGCICCSFTFSIRKMPA